ARGFVAAVTDDRLRGFPAEQRLAQRLLRRDDGVCELFVLGERVDEREDQRDVALGGIHETKVRTLHHRRMSISMTSSGASPVFRISYGVSLSNHAQLPCSLNCHVIGPAATPLPPFTETITDSVECLRSSLLPPGGTTIR